MDHVLTDHRFTVPRPPGDSPLRVAQRRMARWLDGPAHTAARQWATDALAGIEPAALGRRAEQARGVAHVAVLAEALGFADPLACALRQPAISTALLAMDADPSPEAESAMAAQLAASGTDDPDHAANLVGLLHQSLGATAALIAGIDPPVASTLRIGPDGTAVTVPLAAAPFGLGTHACPGRLHAEAFAMTR